MTKQADLSEYVFEGQPHLLSGPLQEWMEASSRFTAFVETYRDKVRKKIRLAREPGSALDLRCELQAAYCLLNDRRLAVAYEPYASTGRRSPDFAVTYRANLKFNLEVARIRMEESETGGIDAPRIQERLLRILLDKLGQMQPGMPNLLVIQAREELARSFDLDSSMQSIKTRAESRDPPFYAAGRYTGPGDFYKDFLHLNGLLLWGDDTKFWVNKQARPELPENVLRLVRQLLSGAPST